MSRHFSPHSWVLQRNHGRALDGNRASLDFDYDPALFLGVARCGVIDVERVVVCVEDELIHVPGLHPENHSMSGALEQLKLKGLTFFLHVHIPEVC